MASKKSSAPKPAPPPRQNTIEVDMAWLEQLPEDEKPRKRGAAGKAGAADGKRNTIPVQSKWLIPPVPKDAAADRPAGSPPPLPASVAVKPRGKLPPPLPREDNED